MAFCDFCKCLNCQNGTQYLFHCKTIDGKFICDVCYDYDLCTSGPIRSDNPCENADCEHRPKLVGEWSKL